MRKIILNLLSFGLAWHALPAGAVGGLEGVSVSGFLTVGATYADKQLLSTTEAVSQDGTIENTPGFTADSRLGLQISAKVNPQISLTGQLLGRAREDNSNVKADWAFVNYRVSEPVSIRAGKIKFPTFLISDYYEVGYAYPWIRPPQEVYSLNPISVLNGADVLAKLRFGDMTLLFQPYYGVSRGATTVAPQEALSSLSPAQAAGSIVNVGFTADELRGVNLSLGSDIFTVRVGFLDTKVNASSLGVFQDKAEFSSVGVSVDWRNIVFYSEGARREIEGMANFAFPNQKAAYATLGYRFGKWLPLVTAARISNNENPATLLGTPLVQTSQTLGLRYELDSGAALKFEAQKTTPKEGTRGLLISSPRSAPKDPGDDVMFYGLSLDVVF